MEESERVLTMLNALMDVAEAETGAMRLEMTEVSVPELINSVVDLYEVVAEEKEISLKKNLPTRSCKYRWKRLADRTNGKQDRFHRTWAYPVSHQ